MENDTKIKEEEVPKKSDKAEKDGTQTEAEPKKTEKEGVPVDENEQFKPAFDVLEGVQTATAPEYVDKIIESALEHRASDVHLEPQQKIVYVRFRMDGVLYYVGKIEKISYENILNRLKVKAHLRVDGHFSAQDGSMRYEKGDSKVDIRVSVIPTIEGEKVVMRMLAVYVASLSLDDIGISDEDQVKLIKASKKPFGMVLMTGPTGSGKTTTLYAIVKTFHSSEINLTSIEDPVEYKIAGANQIQVNLKTNLTFAKGLRSIVRQDPDIILVGEIRDNETAEISVNAALTGHLLFSTFHANDAATGIPRLLDMGVEPFLLTSTLKLIAGQRLVRKICDKCKTKTTINLKDFNFIVPIPKGYFPSDTFEAYAGKGCSACADKGYKGRTAIFEFIEITPEMQELMLRNPSSQEIWALAEKQGSTSMFQDGVKKVIAGVTTLEELLRVASPAEKEMSQTTKTAPKQTPTTPAQPKEEKEDTKKE